jgi:hypothetical protein
MPVTFDKVTAAAFQAQHRGEATPDQQKEVMEFMLTTLCVRQDMSYFPGADGDRDTAFAEGRRFVGNSLARIVRTKLTNLPSRR